jgi:ribose transport system substrate-binding protein
MKKKNIGRGLMIVPLIAGGLVASASATTHRTASAASSPLKIDLIDLNAVSGDPFYGSINCGAVGEGKKLGVKLRVLQPASAEASPQSQLPVLDAAIATKPAAIVMSASSSTALTPTIHQAMKEGIKFVMVDQAISDTKGVSSIITSNNVEVGIRAGQALAKLMGHKGDAAVLDVQAGVPAGDQRVQGFIKGLRGTGVKFDTILRNPSVATSTSASLVSALVAKDTKFGGIYGVIDPLTAGAIAAAKQDGLLGKLKIVDTDTEPSEVAELKSGEIQALIGQLPRVIGADGVQQAVNSLTGKKVTARITPSEVVVTKQNVNSPKVKPYLYSNSCSA